MGYLLQGELVEGALPNLLQFLEQNAVSGCLELRHPDSAQAYLFFEEGHLRHASLGRPSEQALQRDVTALAVLLGWRKGRFRFREGIPVPVRTTEQTLNALLLEASQLADEEMHATGELIHAGSVLQARLPAEGAGQVMMSVVGLQLLNHLNGIETLAEVAKRRKLPLSEALAAAQELFIQNLIELKMVTAPPQLIVDLKQFLVQLLGPVGQIIIEDSLQALNVSEEAVPERALGELAGLLRGELRKPAWRAAFERRFRQLCQDYEVAV